MNIHISKQRFPFHFLDTSCPKIQIFCSSAHKFNSHLTATFSSSFSQKASSVHQNLLLSSKRNQTNLNVMFDMTERINLIRILLVRLENSADCGRRGDYIAGVGWGGCLNSEKFFRLIETYTVGSSISYHNMLKGWLEAVFKS